MQPGNLRSDHISSEICQEVEESCTRTPNYVRLNYSGTSLKSKSSKASELSGTIDCPESSVSDSSTCTCQSPHNGSKELHVGHFRTYCSCTRYVMIACHRPRVAQGNSLTNDYQLYRQTALSMLVLLLSRLMARVENSQLETPRTATQDAKRGSFDSQQAPSPIKSTTKA